MMMLLQALVVFTSYHTRENFESDSIKLIGSFFFSSRNDIFRFFLFLRRKFFLVKFEDDAVMIRAEKKLY